MSSMDNNILEMTENLLASINEIKFENNEISSLQTMYNAILSYWNVVGGGECSKQIGDNLNKASNGLKVASVVNEYIMSINKDNFSIQDAQDGFDKIKEVALTLKTDTNFPNLYGKIDRLFEIVIDWIVKHQPKKIEPYLFDNNIGFFDRDRRFNKIRTVLEGGLTKQEYARILERLRKQYELERIEELENIKKINRIEEERLNRINGSNRLGRISSGFKGL